MITDMHGRLYTYNFNLLESGYHNFRFLPGCEGIYLLTAVWQGITQSIKIMTLGSTSEKRARLEYLGSANNHNAMNFPIVNQGLVMQESGILDIPNTSKTYTFQFATNMPCPDSPVVTYEGQNYNTIQIYSQCWLKENLNVGTMRPGNQSQANDSIKEKYCYGNNLDSCNKYGGLYQWSEMMQYSTIEGTQGICPPGWHLPTQEEWKVLEGAVDSQFGIGDTIWNNIGLQGFDTGENLKTDNGWYEEGNGNDLFGFSGLPGGNRNFIGQFTFVGHLTGYWTSTESDSDNAWCRTLIFDHPEVFRYDHAKSYGFSVRCIKNN
jgi:uncharacterized protein (TIGR02145 family)